MLLAFPFPGLAVGTDVSSSITNPIWTPDNSPYVVSNTIEVAKGATLKIEAGTEVRFNKGAKILVKGELQINGSASNPVILKGLRAAWLDIFKPGEGMNGGAPKFKFTGLMEPDSEALKIGKNVPEMLKSDLEVEYKVVGELKKAMTAAEKAQDYVTRDMLKVQLEDTEMDHAYYLEKQIRLIGLVGVENYLQSQMGSGTPA